MSTRKEEQNFFISSKVSSKILPYLNLANSGLDRQHEYFLRSYSVRENKRTMWNKIFRLRFHFQEN